MDKRFYITVVALGLLVSLGGPAFADVPALISYQGKLTDSDGQPVRDGQYRMSFSVYPREIGGTAPGWQEQNRLVNVAGGVFTVLLGQVTSLPPNGFPEEAWLEIRVDDTVLSPRARLVSAPYAIRAGVAEHVLDTAAVTSLNSLTGDVSLIAGSNISIKHSGNSLILSSTDIPNPLPVQVENSPVVKLDSSQNTVKAQQSGTWNVGITGNPDVFIANSPIIRVDPHQNTVKSQQSGAWNVGIIGNTLVGISEDANKVKVQSQNRMVRLLEQDITMTSGSQISLRVPCHGAKEIRIALEAYPVEVGMPTANWKLFEVSFYFESSTDSSWTAPVGNSNFDLSKKTQLPGSPNIELRLGTYVLPVFGDVLEIALSNTTGYTFTVHRKSTGYLAY